MDACREDMKPLHTSVMLGIFETWNASNTAGDFVQSGSCLSRFSGFYQSFFCAAGKEQREM